MRITELDLRCLIRETLDEQVQGPRRGEISRKWQAAMVDPSGRPQTAPVFRQGGKVDIRVVEPDYKKTGTILHYDVEPASRQSLPVQTKSEKSLKGLWNEYADHDFFRDEVIKVHWFGAYAGKKDTIRSFDKFFDFVSQNVSRNNRNDLSCLGFLKSDPWLISNTLASSDPPFFGVIVKGHVSFAGAGDPMTQWTSMSDPKTLKLHAGSGTVKRPSMRPGETASIETQLDMMMLDEETFRSADKEENELIVDNWRVEKVVINRVLFCKPGVEELVQKLSDIGVPVVWNNNKEYNGYCS